jgi:hypothetical protein
MTYFLISNELASEDHIGAISRLCLSACVEFDLSENFPQILGPLVDSIFLQRTGGRTPTGSRRNAAAARKTSIFSREGKCRDNLSFRPGRDFFVIWRPHISA